MTIYVKSTVLDVSAFTCSEKQILAYKEQQGRVDSLQNEIRINMTEETKLSLQKQLKTEVAILGEMSFLVYVG